MQASIAGAVIDAEAQGQQIRRPLFEVFEFKQVGSFLRRKGNQGVGKLCFVHARIIDRQRVRIKSILVQETSMLLLTDDELAALEAGIDAGDLTHGQMRRLIAELRLTRQHLDAVIAAYQQPGIGPLVNACRVAKEWRGVINPK